ncbi:hypothetical protein QZH41_014704 [Actinostola sp. cb2023]|nr:hypothetical protein QZH41_014704 [Actinostola sp. cb2023]
MLPIPTEVISSLPLLCLPDGGQIYDAPKDSTVHYLVLTDIEGTRTYCCCLKIYKPYMTKENEFIPGQYDLVYADSDSDVEATRDSDYTTCYVPLCCCIISKYPYFGIFKDCLSRYLQTPYMVSTLKVEPRKFRTGIMQFVSQLAMVPIPPPGLLAIEFNLSGITHLVRPVDEPEKKIVDIELHYPFMLFSLDNILVLISCVLTQQRMVFMSSKYAMLTLVIESIFAFIQPLSWSWTYVPVLPNDLVDMTEAPGVYILGCHIILKAQIERAMAMHEMADIIIVNIDEGSITMGENVTVHIIPSRVGDLFKARMKDVSPLFDLQIMNRPSFLNVQDLKKERNRFAMEFNNAALTGQSCVSTSLEMMARMLSDMSTYQETSYQGEYYFDLDAFIESKAEEDQPFYKASLNNKSSHLMGNYLYLRGMFKVACGNRIDVSSTDVCLQ